MNTTKTGGFGGCLLSLRRSRNLSQKALSLMAQMDQSYLAGLEAGRRAPPKEKQICRLIMALDTTANEEQELRAAHAIAKMLDATDGLHSGKGKALASLTEHLQNLTLDQIGMIESLASELQRQTNNRECRNLMK